MREPLPNLPTAAPARFEPGGPAPLARRDLLMAIGSLTLTAAGLSAAPTAWAASPGGNRSGLPWKSGSFVGLAESDGGGAGKRAVGAMLQPITDFDGWRGRPSDVALLYIGQRFFSKDYPAFLKAPALQTSLPALRSAGFTPILSIPLVNEADAGRFADVAAGSIDGHHQAIADRLRQIMEQDKIYLRLGWESDKGYPWSITAHKGAGQPDPANPEDYRNAWRRIAEIYRNTVPGAVMVWNMLKHPPVNWATYYPGDDVVDILSIDLYDNGWGGSFDSDNKAWKRFGLGSYDAASGRVDGLQGVLEFARSRGKKMALDEWAVANQTVSETDGANNNFFVPAVFAFLTEHQDDIEYEIYFNNDKKRRHQIFPPVPYNALPSDAYLAHWRP